MTFTGGSEHIINAVWLAKFFILLGICGIAGWYYTTTFKTDYKLRATLALMLGLHIIPLLAVLHVRLSSGSFLITSFAFGLLGYLIHTAGSKNQSCHNRKTGLPTTALFILTPTIAFLIAITKLGMISHWDHMLAPAVYVLDYAKTGHPYSEWVYNLNYGRWVLSQQTTAISLDAFEMIWFGSFTATLSKYVTLLQFLLIAALVSKPLRWPAVIFLAVIFIFVVEQTVFFRPHIYIGLLLVIIILLQQKNEKSFLSLAILFIAILLAKRDGLIIAPLIAVFFFNRRLSLLIAAIGVPLLILGGTIAKIGGEPVAALLWKSIIEGSTLTSTTMLLSKQNFYLPLLFSCIVYFLFRKKLKLDNIFISILAVSAVIFLSAIILTGNDQYNFGTINRKITYFLMPVIALLVYQISDHIFKNQTSSTLYQSARAFITNFKIDTIPPKEKIIAAVKFSCIVFIVYSVIISTVPLATHLNYSYKNTVGWTRSVVENVDLYRSFFPKSANLKIGFFYEDPKSFKSTPFKDLNLYKFPFVQAYNGEDLNISDQIDDLKDRDVVFVSHEVDKPSCKQLADALELPIRHLYGGMKVLLSEKGLHYFNKKYIFTKLDGTPVDDFLTEIFLQEDNIKWNTNDGFRSYFTTWNPTYYQYKVVWPADEKSWAAPAKFTLKNPGKLYIQAISFKPHHLGDKLPTSIEVETPAGSAHYELESLSSSKPFFIPVQTRGPVTLRMYGDGEASPFWKAPYFSIFNISALALCETPHCKLN